MAKQTKGQVYDGSQIQVLEGLEPVRKRPGMYIGSTGYDGVHHLIKEIADNSIDEAIAGYATKVEVVLLADGGVQVTDNGRGIPVDKHPKTGARDSADGAARRRQVRRRWLQGVIWSARGWLQCSERTVDEDDRRSGARWCPVSGGICTREYH